MSFLNVLKARFLISMKMYFRYPVNVLMTLFEPLMWLSPFYFMGKAFSVNGRIEGFEKYTGNSDYIGFMVLGFMVSAYVSMIFWSVGFSLKDEMRQGVLESNWSSPSNRIALLLGRTLFQFLATTFEVILIGIVCHFAFGFTINKNILKAISFLFPGIIGLFGLGLFVASLVLIAKEAGPIVDITNSTLNALSGMAFPIKVMPRGFVFISMILPMTYVNDSIRALLLGQTPLMPLYKEFLIIVISIFIFWLVGSYAFAKVERKCKELGILGTH